MMSPLLGFLQYLVVSSDGLSTGIMMEMIAGKGEVSWKERVMRISCFFILVLLICLPSWLLKYRVLPFINLCLYVPSTILLLYFLYGVRWKQGVLLFIACYVCEVAGEAVFFLSFPAAAVIPFDWTTDACIEYMWAPILFAAGMKIFFAFLLRSRQSGKLRKDPLHVLFGLFLFCIVLMLPGLYYSMSGIGEYAFSNRDTFNLFICVVLVLSFSGVVFLLQNRQAQKKLEGFETLKNLQDDYYVALEKNSMNMSKLRHDYLNVLRPIGQYVKEYRIEEALSLIEDLTGKIQATGHQNRCSIPVVNAILNEKAQVCDEKQIRFSISLRLMEECYIPDLELCRVFGNMLDNAIRACERIEDPSKRWIELKGSMVQQRLIISCQNSRVHNEKKQIFGTGLGQKILKETAKQFHGHFNTDDTQSDVYRCSIDLLNPQQIQSSTIASSAVKKPC